MPSPPIQVFLTTIASQPALRQRQEYLLRILQVKKISFTSYDLASDEIAKRLWKRKAPLDKQQLPGILVGGKFPGTFSDFEEAVEYGELDQFLRLKETWDDDLDNITKPPVHPIGVPAHSQPLERSQSRSTNLVLVTGVMATEAELADLVAELGLDGDEAGDLVKGLSGGSSAEREEKGKQEIETREDLKELKEESKEKEAIAEVKESKKELKEAPAKSPEESLTESLTISPQEK
ncbi:thioredoxin domain-containing protein [Lentinula edodes]|uniref:Thioredoxin domain-containing protein n=1 Tax=Lentinula edodes TaxID=5353 RepID=A0A1Q3EFP9_LENED|nr:thioredoxin domain-containing protein [Lentinula edodes]